MPILLVSAILVLPSTIQAQADVPELPVSLERIRAALNRPAPRLRLPADVTPTFRVEVRAPLLQPVDDAPFDPTFGLPSVGELFGRGVGKVASAVAGYKRHRAERRARKEVDDALAALCAIRECPAPRNGS